MTHSLGDSPPRLANEPTLGSGLGRVGLEKGVGVLEHHLCPLRDDKLITLAQVRLLTLLANLTAWLPSYSSFREGKRWSQMPALIQPEDREPLIPLFVEGGMWFSRLSILWRHPDSLRGTADHTPCSDSLSWSPIEGSVTS